MSDINSFYIFLLTLTTAAREITASSSQVTADKLYFQKENLSNVPSYLHSEEDVDSITKAIFSHNQFDSLTSDDFNRLSVFSNLKYIFFDHNNISSIEDDTFIKLPKMKFLDLSHNKLNELSDGVYRDLIRLKSLRYVNLKRNPIKSFENIDKLTVNGVQVDYDGVLGREKEILKARNRRVTHGESSIHDGQFAVEEEKMTTRNDEIDKLERFIDEQDEESNFTIVEDKPVKAYVIDKKTNQKNEHRSKVNNFLGSIIFNFLAAFLVLVALPIAMIVYYFMHRNDGIS